MNWDLKYAEELKERFKDRPFTVDLARGVGHYSSNVTYRLLAEVVKKSLIARIGRGIYVADISAAIAPSDAKVEHEVPPEAIPQVAKKIICILSRERDLDFMLTNMSVLAPFMHLLPNRLVHSVYVKPGNGERTLEMLNGNGMKCILEPKNAERVDEALSLVDGDLVVIRETKGLVGRKGHLATVERALADLYYESTRDKIPISPAEVGRILRNAIAHGGINITKTTKLSSWHHLDKEMRGVLVNEGLMPPTTS